MYIALILTVAFVLRLIGINQSFWLDEAAQVIESARPLSQQLNIAADFHPPLFHIILHFWMYLGHSEIIVRFLSILLSLGSIYFVYKIALSLKLKNYALLSSLFLTTSSYHLWYSQETRPYMLFVFISLFSTYILLNEKWGIYLISVFLGLYSHYFFPFVILSHLIYVVVFNKKKIRSHVISFFIASLGFLPWLPYFFQQLQIGTNGFFSGWTNVVSVTAFKLIPLTFAKFILGKTTFSNDFLYAISVVPVFCIFLISVYKLIKNENGKKILLLFFSPLLSLFLISFFVPVVAPQRLIFLLPFFYIILSLAISTFTKYFKFIGIGIILATNLITSVDYMVNPSIQREQWREAVRFVESSEEKESSALFVFPEPFAPYLWYKQGKINYAGVAPSFTVTQADLENKKKFFEMQKRIYLFQYLTGLTDPNHLTENFLLENGFQKQSTHDFTGVGFVYVFTK